MDDTAHTPEQPDLLLGAAPDQQESALAAAFVGTVRDAVVLDTDSKVRLQVVLDQHIAHHPQAVPLLVVWPLPDQGDYWATRQWGDALCRRLLSERMATALGKGLEAGTHHKQPVFRLLNVTGITPAITATETAPA